VILLRVSSMTGTDLSYSKDRMLRPSWPEATKSVAFIRL
jgi:hypothetical protein